MLNVGGFMIEDQDFVELKEMQDQPKLNLVTYVDNDVSISEWVVTMLLMCIPIANIILLFVWAFDSSAKLSKSNWAKASLIFVGISFIVGIFCAIIFGSIFSSLMGGAAKPSSFY
jgi:hypothetical protein